MKPPLLSCACSLVLWRTTVEEEGRGEVVPFLVEREPCMAALL